MKTNAIEKTPQIGAPRSGWRCPDEGGLEVSNYNALEKIKRLLLNLECITIKWMSRHSMVCLQGSLGLIFISFGALKFFPGMSPAEGLAGNTLNIMSFGWLEPAISVPVLGVWECLLGIGLMLGSTSHNARFGSGSVRGVILRLTLPALFLHMLGTTFPIALMPECIFGSQSGDPLLTLECQYIIKNIVLVSAAIAVGGQFGRPPSMTHELKG